MKTEAKKDIISQDDIQIDVTATSFDQGSQNEIDDHGHVNNVWQRQFDFDSI